MPTAGSSPSWSRSPPTATSGWRRRPTPMAAGCAPSRRCPTWATSPSMCRSPASCAHETTRPLGELMRDIYAATTPTAAAASGCSARTRPTRNRLGAVFEVDRPLPAGAVRGRRHALPRRPGHGGALRAPLPGLARGLPADRPARAVRDLRGLRDGLGLDGGPARQVAAARAASCRWRAPVSSLNVLLTSTCWRNDHNGFSHQGPGLIDSMLPLAASVVRVWLPPDANSLLSIADHCLRSREHVNLIVVDKQPHLQYLDLDAADAHCAAGAGIWEWAGNVAADGEARTSSWPAPATSPTQETLAAAELLREHAPGPRVRVVNVVDLMALLPEADHPHGFPDSASTNCSRPTSTSSSPSTATLGRSTSSSTAGPTPGASTCAASASRARRRHRSTWWYSTA